MANAARKPKIPDVVKLGIIRNHDKHPDGPNHPMTKAIRRFDNLNSPLSRRELRRVTHNNVFPAQINVDAFTQALLIFHGANPRASYRLGLFIAEQLLPLCQYRTITRKLEQEPRSLELFQYCKDYITDGKWSDSQAAANLHIGLQNSASCQPQLYNRYAAAPLLELSRGVSSDPYQAIYWYRPLYALNEAIMAQPDKAAIDTFLAKVYDEFVNLIETIQNDGPFGD